MAPTTPPSRRRWTPFFAEVAKLEGVKVTSPYDSAGRAQFNSYDQPIVVRPARSPNAARPSSSDWPTRSRHAATRSSPRSADRVRRSDLRRDQVPARASCSACSPRSIILLLAFGSVLAMGLPIGTAIFGLGVGTGVDRYRQSTGIVDARLLAADRRDDRPRRRYRLRAVHRRRVIARTSTTVSTLRPPWSQRSTPAVVQCSSPASPSSSRCSGLHGDRPGFVDGLAIASALARAGDDARRRSHCCRHCSASPAAQDRTARREPRPSPSVVFVVHRTGRRVRQDSALLSFAVGLPSPSRQSMVASFLPFGRRAPPAVAAPRPRSRASSSSGTAGVASSSVVRGRPLSAAPRPASLLALPLFSIRLGFTDTGC